jgi:PPM family protein phosphatase
MSKASVSVEVYGCTDTGKVRKGNEDAFVIADLGTDSGLHATEEPFLLEVGRRGILLAVSDGMGGAKAGEVASALALHSLRRGLLVAGPGTAEQALVGSVERANKEVWNAAAVAGRDGMGATLTVVLIHGRQAYVAEVGDSRAYVLRGRRFIPLTHDQSCVQLLVDSGKLTQEEADVSQFKNVIMQAIGTKPTVVVALTRLSLRRGDRILLCSDGLSGVVKDDEMLNLLLSTPKLDDACKKLVDLANARGGPDNITVVVAETDGEGLPAWSGEDRVSLETVQAFTG